MSRYYYDLHIHSCLSPCGDNDMTPNNIAGMCKLNNLNIAALTDHNSTLNCPAFFEAAARYGIVPVAGMELTTAEDIHVVCLFPTLSDAMAFGEEVNRHRILIPNRTDIFGDQLILNGEDEVIGTEEHLLPNATDISLEQSVPLAGQFNGVCWPAHIDREANGVIFTLGTFPDEPAFPLAELHDGAKAQTLRRQFPQLEKKPFVISSDAHYLEQLRDAENWFELAGGSDDDIRAQLFAVLRQKEFEHDMP